MTDIVLKITAGPSREKLFKALRLKKSVPIDITKKVLLKELWMEPLVDETVTFHLFVNSIDIEEDDDLLIIFSGCGVTLEAKFNTTYRKGSVKLV